MSDLYVIRKRGYFYRPEAEGYTSSISEAWKVPKEEAEKHINTDPSGPVTIHPASEYPIPTPPSLTTYTAEQVKPLVEALRFYSGEDDPEAARKWMTPVDDPNDKIETLWDMGHRAREALKQFGEG